MFEQYMTEELYKMRDACDRIEDPLSYPINSGLCSYTCHEGKLVIPSYILIDSFFKPTEEERQIFPNQGIAFYLGNYKETPEENNHTRIIAAGFLACLIDDELITRGE